VIDEADPSVASTPGWTFATYAVGQVSRATLAAGNPRRKLSLALWQGRARTGPGVESALPRGKKLRMLLPDQP
jgi:hypothetical protein